MRDLSVVIPARKEEWLSRTVDDVLANSRADTEVIVVLDGAWPEQPLKQHPNLTVLFEPKAIGQRAAMNVGARVSTAKFLAKLDAHCSVAEGWDVALIEAADELGPDCTQIPGQKNLHIYSWKCHACGKEQYQGPKRTLCPACGVEGQMARVMVWQPRRGVHTTSWRLDSELHFQYWREGQRAQTGDLCDVMTSLGACFFMTRERFCELDGMDENTGSWGQFGAEIALKSWLSGGRHVVNKRTWFAHFFRVGGIGFPYPIKGSEQEYARQYFRNLWRGNQWPKQVKPLRWLVDQFWPVPGWTEADRAALPASLPRSPSEVAA